jgi:hypothetical protein
MQKTWFVTGASRGFGRIWAEATLTRGDQVTATARNLADVADLTERFGDALLPLALDVTDPEQVRQVVRSFNRRMRTSASSTFSSTTPAIACSRSWRKQATNRSATCSTRTISEWSAFSVPLCRCCGNRAARLIQDRAVPIYSRMIFIASAQTRRRLLNRQREWVNCCLPLC